VHWQSKDLKKAVKQAGIMKPTLDDAILLAAQAHHGQRDKNGQPYILHPLRVMFRLDTESERIVGVLHDVIEDTKYTAEDLRQMGYPEEILQALDGVTKREGEPYEDFVFRSKANPIARRVKLADLEDNMDLRRMTGVTPKDMERLARYRKAWAELQKP
jgi:(p)ppGpp synthase/HD superfamily hydrolase